MFWYNFRTKKTFNEWTKIYYIYTKTLFFLVAKFWNVDYLWADTERKNYGYQTAYCIKDWKLNTSLIGNWKIKVKYT